jgi:hypothetical protein
MVSTRSRPDAKDDKGGLSRGLKVWVHAPSNLVTLWLVISLPLVLWDTGYVLLRPHSMPGGSLHSLWTPYALYGAVDYIYGWPAYNSHNGFTGAQSTMNLVETVFYIWYLWLIYSFGRVSTRGVPGAPGAEGSGAFGESRVVSGKAAGVAALVGFGTAVMTLSKTLLYCEFPYIIFLHGASLLPEDGFSRMRHIKTQYEHYSRHKFWTPIQTQLTVLNYRIIQHLS